MGKHSRKQVKGEFCGNAASGKCGCSFDQDYRENCKPRWKDHEYVQIGARRVKFKKGYEAHHILCVATVGKVLIGGKGISKIIHMTKWCVNRKVNMIAMPLWGHTIKYYCDIKAKTIRKIRKQPPFKNLPQHDWDHNCAGGYRHEVEEELLSLRYSVDENAANHTLEAQQLADSLDALSKEFKDRLKARGSRRQGGTHKGWNKGKKDPTSRWFEPFSMARDEHITAKGYPAPDFKDETADKLAWLKKQLTGR